MDVIIANWGCVPRIDFLDLFFPLHILQGSPRGRWMTWQPWNSPGIRLRKESFGQAGKPNAVHTFPAPDLCLPKTVKVPLLWLLEQLKDGFGVGQLWVLVSSASDQLHDLGQIVYALGPLFFIFVMGKSVLREQGSIVTPPARSRGPQYVRSFHTLYFLN